MPQSLAQADLATARIGTIQSSRELVRARQNLARKLAMDETQLQAVAGDLRASFLPADLDPSHYRRPDLEAWSMQGQAAQTDVAAAQRARIPNPVISYSREEAGHEIEHMFQVGIEVPILNNKVPAVRQKAAAYDTVRAQRSATANEVALEREQAFQRLAETQEALRTYDQEAAPAIRLSLAAAKSAFQSGTANLTLLLQTQSRLIELERGQMRAVVALRKAELETLLALGAPRG
jgi:outer membrane protein TolC